jgi:V8-like Glu-specific endopeptidase
MNSSLRRLGATRSLAATSMCLAFSLLGAGCSADASSTDAARQPPGTEVELTMHRDVEGPETVDDAVAALGTEAANADYAGIVALSNCSGSFVRFTTSKASDKGLVLTNGHCYENGTIKAGTAVANRSSRRTFQLLNPSGTGNLGRLTASRIVYGTMTGSDFLIYELTETFAQINARLKTAPLTIADQRPSLEEPILIASGYWRRKYSCSIASFIYRLREGTWTFEDSIKYSEPGCEVIGGTSGSPILRPSTREVIGINNTGNMNGGRCTVNNPCEVDESGGIVVDKGGSYGQELYGIYGCLTATNAFDPTLPGCTLQKP